MATVFVTDGNERSALAVVRSLGRAGHRVIVGAGRANSLSAASRWCAGEALVPEVGANREGYADAIAAIANRLGADFVLPVTDASVLAVLSRPPAAPVRIPMGDYASFAAMSDKSAVAEVAASFGLRVPRQVRLASASDAATLVDGMTMPVVLKPTRSVSLVGGAKHRVVHARDRAALLAAAMRLPFDAYPVLVQERIIGPGMGVFLLRWGGELLATFAHRRLREKPAAGGVSVLCESVALEPGLLDRSRRLVEAFGWSGVAMVEFKVDALTGEPVLMEINGRFWGSLQLAIDAGVDFPRLLVDVAEGRPMAPIGGYRVGVRSRWMWGDVDHLLARLTRSASALSLPPDAPGRLRAAADFVLSTVSPGPDQVFRWSDPWPLWRESASWMRAALRR